MRLKISTIFKLLKEAFQEWQQDKVSRLAAALAYYTVFSIQILLFGAEFTQVYARKFGKKITPNRHAQYMEGR